MSDPIYFFYHKSWSTHDIESHAIYFINSKTHSSIIKLFYHHYYYCASDPNFKNFHKFYNVYRMDTINDKIKIVKLFRNDYEKDLNNLEKLLNLK